MLNVDCIQNDGCYDIEKYILGILLKETFRKMYKMCSVCICISLNKNRGQSDFTRNLPCQVLSKITDLSESFTVK